MILQKFFEVKDGGIEEKQDGQMFQI